MKRVGLLLLALAIVATGSCANASDKSAAKTVAQSNASVPARVPPHIPTYAYDQRYAQGSNASPDQVRRYLTYAQSGLGNNKAQLDCAGSGGCSSVFYFNPAFVYDSSVCPFSASKDFLAAARESWFVHLPGTQDKAHRVHGTYTQNCKGTPLQVPVYVVNQSNPEVAAFFRDYLRRNADSWDFYNMDDTSTTMDRQFYGPGGGFCKEAIGMPNGICTSTAEIADDRSLQQAHETFVNALRKTNGSQMKFFYNGVGFGPEGPRIALLSNSQFVGAICEGCVVATGTLRTAMYAKVLDAMAAVNKMPRVSFVELNTGASPEGSDDQIAQRLVTTAMAWLGFKPGQTIVWPNLEYNTRNLAVWPEDNIYPAGPLQTMNDSSRELQVAPLVWRREFNACFNNSRPIGPCAAVVNGSAAPVTVSSSWFRNRFDHALQLRGGDSLNGGSLDFTSAPSAVTLAPGHAILLIR